MSSVVQRLEQLTVAVDKYPLSRIEAAFPRSALAMVKLVSTWGGGYLSVSSFIYNGNAVMETFFKLVRPSLVFSNH